MVPIAVAATGAASSDGHEATPPSSGGRTTSYRTTSDRVSAGSTSASSMVDTGTENPPVVTASGVSLRTAR